MPLGSGVADYRHVCAAVEFINRHHPHRPEVEETAAAIGLTGAEFHDLCLRWAGLTPKALFQAISPDPGRALLQADALLAKAALEVGGSGPWPAQDPLVLLEVLSPDARRTQGAGLNFTYGFHPSPFGEAILVATSLGLAGLGWADPSRECALDDMRRRWPQAEFHEAHPSTMGYAARVFDPRRWRVDPPLRVVLIGTDFEIRVWKLLLTIPLARATTYSTLAQALGKPKGARAIGGAVGRNPISFVVPCHRVLGKSGAFTGYHWGLARKQAILGWEAGQIKSGETLA